MPVSRRSIPKTYAELRRGVEAVVLKGRVQIEPSSPPVTPCGRTGMRLRIGSRDAP